MKNQSDASKNPSVLLRLELILL